MGVDRAISAGGAAVWGGRAERICAAVVNALFYVLTAGCQWRLLPTDFPPLLDGAGVLLWLARRRHLGADQPASADGGARGGRARGEPVGGRDRQPVGEDDGSRRAARLRCRQEDQGPQAPHPHRHQRAAGGGHRPCRRYPGSGRGGPLLASIRPPFPGCGTCSPTAAMPATNCRPRWPRSALDARDRQAIRCRQGLPASCRAAGWSSAPSPGSTATAASPKTSRPPCHAESWLMMASVKLLSRRLARG